MNASMAHALDFDDTLDHGGSIHPGASVLAASLAVSDMLGGVTGQSLLLAVALGLDMSCRVASPPRSTEVGPHRRNSRMRRHVLRADVLLTRPRRRDILRRSPPARTAGRCRIARPP